jgi:uncharacterized membrane protein YedE/YeeE
MNNLENKNTDTEGINGSQIKRFRIIKLKISFWLESFFGIVFVKAEIISWFRIQEMFQLQSFFMYGVIGSAVVVGVISPFRSLKDSILKPFREKKSKFSLKVFSKGQIYGGLLFGFGWAITGACPGPLFAQIGTGVTVIVLTLLSAIAGTWFYGLIKDKLPH